MNFMLDKCDGQARRARLEFERGVVETPAFMPVGTYGTVKAMTPEELIDLGAQIILGNTFHLMLRPGTEIINQPGEDAQDHRGGRYLCIAGRRRARISEPGGVDAGAARPRLRHRHVL